MKATLRNTPAGVKLHGKSRKHLHVPSHLPQEDFAAGRMKPFSYSMNDIAKAIAKHTSRPVCEQTAVQLEGWEKYKQLGFGPYYPTDTLYMMQWFDIFNKFFFNGVLTGYCTLEIMEDTHLRLGIPAAGHCKVDYPGLRKDPRFRVERANAHIRLNTRLPKDGGNIYCMMELLLPDLLHEMIHAILNLFGCLCGGTECDDYGWKGHGPSWQAIGSSLEDLWARSFLWGGFEEYDDADKYRDWLDKSRLSIGPWLLLLGVSLHLSRELSMVFDVTINGPLPTDLELVKMGLDKEDFIDYLYDIHRSDARKDRSQQIVKSTRRANVCLRDQWVIEGPNRASIWDQSRENKVGKAADEKNEEKEIEVFMFKSRWPPISKPESRSSEEQADTGRVEEVPEVQGKTEE